MSSLWTLRRSTSDVKLAGLCSGLARQWGVDPVLVRVGFALLALSGGIGLILYLAGWVLLPVEGRDTAPVEDMFGEAARRWPRELWIAVVVIACVAGFALFGWLTPFGIGPALVIALIWYFGFYRPRTGARSAPPPPAAVSPAPVAPFRYPGPATPFTEAAQAWQQRIAEYQAAGGPPAAVEASWPAPPPANLGAAYAPSPTPAYASQPPAPPVPAAHPEQVERAAFLATPDPVGLYVEPTGSTATPALVRPGHRASARRLRWAALLVLGLTMTGLGIADRLGAEITPLMYAAAALLVAGVTLVVATWLGRARGLLPIGALLAAGVLGLSAVSAGVPGASAAGLPEPVLAYADPAALPAGGDHLDVGTMTVDLRELELREDTTYRAKVDLGTLVVKVPPTTDVVVRYRVDLGSVTGSDGSVRGGTELAGTLSDPQPGPAGEPTLTLDLAVDVGSVQVRR